MSGGHEYEWVAWLLILGFFPAACAISALVEWVWDREGNPIQRRYDTWVSGRTIRAVDRHLKAIESEAQ